MESEQKPLPKHDTDYESGWDDEAALTRVWIICPKCKQLTEIGWDGISAGSKHKCEDCGYEWEITNKGAEYER